jgi:hypothetical protein
LSSQSSRGYLVIASALVIAGLLISASLFLAVGGAKTVTTTTTETSVSTSTLTEACSAAGSAPGTNLIFRFEVVVNYSGPWNATLTAFSGPGAVFMQCYFGNGTGLIGLNDWNPNGSATLQVIAHKMDGSSSNLTLTVNSETSSTVAPFGLASVSVSLPATLIPIEERTGPISSFPVSWIEVCNLTATGNTTTSVSLDLNASSIFDHINLNQIYAQVINFPLFVQLSEGHGWVVADWTASQGGGTGISGEVDQVTGRFILTSNGNPERYVWAYYDLQNETVTFASQSLGLVDCPSQPVAIVSPGDLSLELSIGAPDVGQPNAVQLNITEYNDATSYNNVSASSGWPVSSLSLGPCGTLEFPFGIAVYQGHYTSQNISSATPLRIFTPNANGTAQPYQVDCPANPQVFSYDFAPQSDSATTSLTWAGDSSSTTYRLSASFSITGYWNSSSNFTVFGKGTYTIVAGDEWGKTAFQYFTMPGFEYRS